MFASRAAGGAHHRGKFRGCFAKANANDSGGGATTPGQR
jgi:hypothetical protein